MRGRRGVLDVIWVTVAGLYAIRCDECRQRFSAASFERKVEAYWYAINSGWVPQGDDRLLCALCAEAQGVPCVIEVDGGGPDV